MLRQIIPSRGGVEQGSCNNSTLRRVRRFRTSALLSGAGILEQLFVDELRVTQVRSWRK